MNSIKSKTAKIAVGFVAIAFALTVAATPVAAQTTAELQAQISALLAQIASLQASMGGSMTMGHAPMAPLTLGSSGAEVSALQTWLMSKGFSIPAGATGYFGAQTQAALAAFQSANGITPAAGYYGPITAAKVAMMTGGTTTGGGSTGGSTGGTMTGGLSGGAGDITVTDRSSGTENEVLEGDEDVKVLGFEVEADGSDVAVTSVRVEFEHSGTGSDKLDRYVDSVSIMMGNEVVGTADVDDFSENSDEYTHNISVKNAVVDEDEKARFYVAITAANNVDSDDLGTDWEVALGQIRFNDATGAILTDNTGTGLGGSISETFSFEDLSSSGDIELSINEDDESINDAHTIQADDSSDTNDVEILSFTLEADGSDITLNDMTFDVDSSGAGVTEIANDFRLLMDGEEVGTVYMDANEDGDHSDAGDTFASSTDTSISLIVTDLDDDDVMIEEGDTVSFTLVADINDIDGAFSNGDSLSASLAHADVDADDENGDSVDDVTGSADSSSIKFSSSGIMVEEGPSDSSERVFNLDTTSTDDQGKFVINFTVTAFEDTAYIALTAASSTSAVTTTAGAYAYVESTNADDVAIGTGTTTVTLERVSGGTLSGNYVRINAGQTATLRMTLYHDAATSGTYRAQLYAVNFAGTAVAGTTQQLAVPTEDFQSPSEQILN